MNLTRRDRYLIYLGAELALGVLALALFVFVTQRALLLIVALGALVGVLSAWQRIKRG